jgi:hypothetical protein
MVGRVSYCGGSFDLSVLGLNSSPIQIFHMADELYDNHMASFGLVQLKDEWKFF